MPELAEVELARRIWEPGLGHQIVSLETHPRTRVYRDTPASEFNKKLPRMYLTASRSHGKRLLFSFSETRDASPSLHIEVHLGMSGRLFLAAPDYETAKHDHFHLRTRNLSLVYSDYRQFGRVYLHPHTNGDPWAPLPHQVLDRRFTLSYLRKLCERRQNTKIKALLLDQSVFPGVGNWMADEICWRLPCHPAAPLHSLDLAEFRKVCRTVCRGAMRHVADKNAPVAEAEGFSPGRYVEQVPPPSWLFQHRWKAGGACPRCKKELARGTIATRTTAWCPACQPEE